jgi:hypothetical protein
MGKKIFGFVILLGLLCNYCITEKNYLLEVQNLKYNLPNDYKRTGLITSSTYQVYFQVRANDYIEGLKTAKRDCINLSLEYILQEPFIFANITYNGKLKLKRIIEEKGRIIYFNRVSENDDMYEVVFHITDYDLRNQFKKIR